MTFCDAVTDTWSQGVDFPSTELDFFGLKGGAFTFHFSVPGIENIPNKIRIATSCYDSLTVLWVSVARAPLKGENLSTPSLAVFDFGTKGQAISRNTSEGLATVEKEAADLSEPTGAWDDYLVLMETRNTTYDDRTDSEIKLDFHDVNGAAIGTTIDTRSAISDGNQRIAQGKIAALNVKVPSPTFERGTENPPLPVFYG